MHSSPCGERLGEGGNEQLPQNRLTPVARKLRRDQTEAEKLLWSKLRNRQLEGAKFVRQLPVGPYIVDFACRSLMLIVELDGGQHAENRADEQRTSAIENLGYRVIRFWNNDVLANVEGVVDAIGRELRLARNGDT